MSAHEFTFGGTRELIEARERKRLDAELREGAARVENPAELAARLALTVDPRERVKVFERVRPHLRFELDDAAAAQVLDHAAEMHLATLGVNALRCQCVAPVLTLELTIHNNELHCTKCGARIRPDQEQAVEELLVAHGKLRPREDR